MVFTHGQKKEALQHVLTTVLEMDPDEDGKVFEAMRNSDISTINMLCDLTRQDVIDLVVKDGDIGYKISW